MCRDAEGMAALVLAARRTRDVPPPRTMRAQHLSRASFTSHCRLACPIVRAKRLCSSQQAATQLQSQITYVQLCLVVLYSALALCLCLSVLDRLVSRLGGKSTKANLHSRDMRSRKLPRFGNKGGPRCLDSAACGGPRRRQKVSIHSTHFAPRSLLDGATTRETQRPAERAACCSHRSRRYRPGAVARAGCQAA